jgi:hypothetical protein
LPRLGVEDVGLDKKIAARLITKRLIILVLSVSRGAKSPAQDR